jgi:hypothetical protein
MELKEVYERCGLKDPDDFKAEVMTAALFSDHETVKNVVWYKRRLGKTTKFMITGLHNLFEGKSTIIWVTNFSLVRDCHHNFLKYSSLFPELNIWVDNNGQFSASFNNKKATLKFATKHNGIPQATIGFRYDIELDDSY